MYHTPFWLNNCKPAVMIKLLKYVTILVFISVLCYSISSSAQNTDMFNRITSAVGKGDAHELSANFFQNISVKTDNSEGDYSKTQSEVLLDDFFHRNKPLSFSIDSKGGLSSNSEYIIGKYKTAKETYRVYILIKEISAQKLIQQISFEKE